MATNTLLNSTVITREALRILHQKLNFIGNINRTYDNRFAQQGAKIGTTLDIRLPNQYTVRTGATLSAQDTVEQKQTMTVATQKGVDVEFTSLERTMKLDDFSQIILEPAMSVLASAIEADALSMTKDIYQQVGTAGTPPTTLAHILAAGVKLDNALAPRDGNRNLLVTPQTQANLVSGLSGLFQDSTQISKQYREGIMGRTAGFDWYANTLMDTMINGTQVFTAAAIATAPTEGGTTMTVTGTGTNVLKKGTVLTFSNIYEVHPETKATTSRQVSVVVTADVTGIAGAFAITFSPALYTSTSGGRQNVSALPVAGTTTVTSNSGAASTSYQQNLAFHKDAFAFVSADLIMPKGVDFAAREVMDGISMRIVQQYDIGNDTLPCRIDVLYGYKTIRPQLACRITE